MGAPEGDGAALYASYRREIEGERLGRALQVGAWVVVFLNTALFIPLDALVFPELFRPMLAVRIACDAILLPIGLRTARSHPLPSAVVGCGVTGAMLLAVIHAAGGASGDYAPGLMLLFLGMPVLLPLSARQAGGIVGALFAGLALLPPLTGTLGDPRGYLLHLIFPLAAAFESVAACALLERMRFADFRRRQELERARAELEVLDREKSRFTANVHHELRTPLTLLLAPVEGMLAGDFGPVDPLQRSYLETVHGNGLRLLRLINDLLDLAKSEGRQLQIRREHTDLGALLEGLLAGARPLAERKGVALAARGLAELAPLHVDPAAVEKIAVNLVGNALKFTEPGGRIEVAATPDPQGGVHLVVADSGAGIPPEQLERIFDRFAQVDASSTRQHEGTGIGLSLVRELVDLHGGRIWAESEGAGQGTRLHVVLPHGEADAAPEEPGGGGDALALADLARSALRAETVATDDPDDPGDPEGPETAPADAPEVLVVEDNAEMRRLLRFLLSREFRVRTARNGREGLEAVRQRAPELVLTDVMMPEMNGLELCRALRASPQTRAVPVVLVTSKAEREMKIEGLELGADDYVTKPFHPRELLARVRALVRLRRLQEELEARNASLERSNAELERALADLREAEVQLVQAERLGAVGELAAGVAHEVNNPVNFASNALHTLRAYVEDLRGFAERVVALPDLDSAEAARSLQELRRLREELGLKDVADGLHELVEIVAEGLGRTQRLVGHLGDLATPRAAEDAPVDLGRCLRSTLELVGPSLRASGVALEVDLPEQLPPVQGSAGALAQVFLNLLKNAAEALDAGGGSVRVSARAASGEVAVEVRDDGPGIEPELRARLFEPFFTTRAAGRGTGLGLSISRRIVGEHGGRIEVVSEPGRGAAFTVRLPAAGGALAA